jgi:tRNA A-37 threonylcarbamoyl transferase component Bud32
MKLTADQIDQIKHSKVWYQQRISVYSLADQQVLIKGQRPTRGVLRYQILNVFASLLRLPLLKAAPAPGGAASQAIEQRRLNDLAKQGVNVPALLHSDGEFIVMQYLAGHSLLHQIEHASSAAQGLEYWEQGLQAIANLHQRQGYLSQAFARNLMWHQDEVWFIDFEDDPAQVMKLDQAQARDWLAYLHSTIWSLQQRGHRAEQLLPIWQHAMNSASAPVADTVRQTAKRLAWLRYLPQKRKPWGRDVVIVQALAAFFTSGLKNF